MIKLLKNNVKCQSSEGQCHRSLYLSNNVFEYEVNRLSNEKLLEENETN